MVMLYYYHYMIIKVRALIIRVVMHKTFDIPLSELIHLLSFCGSQIAVCITL